MKTLKQLTAGTIIALLLTAGNLNAKGTETKALSHENTETSLQLEAWMIDNEIWDKTMNTNFIIIREPDQVPEIENWMTDTKVWNRNASLDTETDAGLTLEKWMINEEIWDDSKLTGEPGLTVESWMLEEIVWNR